MAYQYALYEKKGRIARVTINRPEVMNALHPQADEELSRIWDDFQADDEMWVAILTGAGERAFCAGRDLKWSAEHPEDLRQPRRTKGGFGGLTHRFDLFKPVIAAVNGFALGGGLELVLASDIAIAAEHAELGLPEPRVGLFAGGGGVHRLPRHIPLKIAMGMLLTGKRIPAQEAHRWGLVNQVVPLKDLLPTAEKWAYEILECAPLSVRASKEMALLGLGYPLEVALTRQYEGQLRAVYSEDRLEGPKAFAEKRKPRWKGR